MIGGYVKARAAAASWAEARTAETAPSSRPAKVADVQVEPPRIVGKRPGSVTAPAGPGRDPRGESSPSGPGGVRPPSPGGGTPGKNSGGGPAGPGGPIVPPLSGTRSADAGGGPGGPVVVPPASGGPVDAAPLGSGDPGPGPGPSPGPDPGPSAGSEPGPGAGEIDAGAPGETLPLEPTVDEQALAEGVQKTVEGHMGLVRRCWENAAKQGAEPIGVVEVEFAVAQSGDAQNIRVVRNETGSPVLGDCIVALVGRWQFPRHGGDPVVFAWPFLFRSAK